MIILTNISTPMMVSGIQIYGSANYGYNVNITKRYLTAPISYNLISNNLEVHGIYAFNMHKNGGVTSKLINGYQTESITIAAFEAPVRLEGGTVIGDYQVHILI